MVLTSWVSVSLSSSRVEIAAVKGSTATSVHLPDHAAPLTECKSPGSQPTLAGRSVFYHVALFFISLFWIPGISAPPPFCPLQETRMVPLPAPLFSKSTVVHLQVLIRIHGSYGFSPIVSRFASRLDMTSRPTIIGVSLRTCTQALGLVLPLVHLSTACRTPLIIWLYHRTLPSNLHWISGHRT